jgi:hypothetical protein
MASGLRGISFHGSMEGCEYESTFSLLIQININNEAKSNLKY